MIHKKALIIKNSVLFKIPSFNLKDEEINIVKLYDNRNDYCLREHNFLFAGRSVEIWLGECCFFFFYYCCGKLFFEN